MLVSCHSAVRLLSYCFHCSLSLAFSLSFLPLLPFLDLSSDSALTLSVVFRIFCNLLVSLSQIFISIFTPSNVLHAFAPACIPRSRHNMHANILFSVHILTNKEPFYYDRKPCCYPSLIATVDVTRTLSHSHSIPGNDFKTNANGGRFSSHLMNINKLFGVFHGLSIADRTVGRRQTCGV